MNAPNFRKLVERPPMPRNHEVRVPNLTQQETTALLDDLLERDLVREAQVFVDGKRVPWGIKPRGRLR